MLVSLFIICCCKSTYLFCYHQIMNTIFLIVYYKYGYKKNELEKKSNSFSKAVGSILFPLTVAARPYPHGDCRLYRK